eukprot:14931432-Ditylum_brightwellii.AAC.1
MGEKQDENTSSLLSALFLLTTNVQPTILMGPKVTQKMARSTMMPNANQNKSGSSQLFMWSFVSLRSCWK